MGLFGNAKTQKLATTSGKKPGKSSSAGTKAATPSYDYLADPLKGGGASHEKDSGDSLLSTATAMLNPGAVWEGVKSVGQTLDDHVDFGGMSEGLITLKGGEGDDAWSASLLNAEQQGKETQVSLLDIGKGGAKTSIGTNTMSSANGSSMDFSLLERTNAAGDTTKVGNLAISAGDMERNGGNFTGLEVNSSVAEQTSTDGSTATLGGTEVTGGITTLDDGTRIEGFTGDTSLATIQTEDGTVDVGKLAIESATHVKNGCSQLNIGADGAVLSGETDGASFSILDASIGGHSGTAGFGGGVEANLGTTEVTGTGTDGNGGDASVTTSLKLGTGFGGEVSYGDQNGDGQSVSGVMATVPFGDYGVMVDSEDLNQNGKKEITGGTAGMGPFGTVTTVASDSDKDGQTELTVGYENRFGSASATGESLESTKNAGLDWYDTMKELLNKKKTDTSRATP